MPPHPPVLYVNRAFRVMTWKKVVKTRGVKWKQEKLKCCPMKALEYLSLLASPHKTQDAQLNLNCIYTGGGGEDIH